MSNRIKRLADFQSRQPLFQIRKLVWYILFAVQILLVLRLLLKLLGAHPAGEFTNVMYSTTSLIIYPFSAVFGPGVSNGGVIEWATLFAIIAYWILAVAVTKTIEYWISPRSRIERARMLSIDKYTQLSTDGFLKRLYKKL